jgi:hypothetical protein
MLSKFQASAARSTAIGDAEILGCGDGIMNEKGTATYGAGLNRGTDRSALPADRSDDIHSDAHNLFRLYALNSGRLLPQRSVDDAVCTDVAEPYS